MIEWQLNKFLDDYLAISARYKLANELAELADKEECEFVLVAKTRGQGARELPIPLQQDTKQALVHLLLAHSSSDRRQMQALRNQMLPALQYDINNDG